MPVIGYSDPDENGGRTFQTDDGAELYFFGPEADALAADIERTKRPDMRLAQAAPPVDFGGVADFERQWAPPPAPPAPPAQMRRDVPMMQKRSEVAVPPATPQLPGTGQPAQAPLAPAPPEMVTLPGSRGVNPEALKARGVMVPTGETVSEAVPVDPELQELRGEISFNEQMLRQRQADTQARKAYAQELQAAAALPELEMRAAEAQHTARQIEQLYEQERSDIGAMLDEHRSKRVDPKRYFNSLPAFGQTMNVIGVIMGALASGVTAVHGPALPNVALEEFNRRTEQDIALQEKEIDRDGANTRNALALLQHRFGDMQQAKDALKLAMLDVADMQAREVTASFGTAEAEQAYQAWQIEHMKEREALERKIRDGSVGKHSTQFKFTQPVAGSSARRVPVDQLPLAEQVKYYKGQAEISKAKATVAGGGVDPDVSAKGQQTQQTTANEYTRDLGKLLSQSEQSVQSYDSAIAALGLRYNADSGKIEGWEDPKTGDKVDLPGVGLAAQYVPDLAVGEKGRRFRQHLRNAADMLLRDRSGASAPEGEVEKLTRIVLGAGTEKEAIEGLEMLRKQIETKRDAERAAFGPGAAQQLDQNRAAIERARTQKTKAAELEPY
jgi:hypothetical protein